jgi:enamine deaminase RidA (YjgF/YER057c/UK114 family)
MPKRRSIHIEGFVHKNPIPNASRIGNLLMSSIINGVDPATGKVAPTLEQQVRFMFEHVRAIMEQAGGSPDDIVKMTVWMKDRAQRDAVNVEWVKMFPDEHARPARHTMRADLEGGLLVQCDITAVFA